MTPDDIAQGTYRGQIMSQNGGIDPKPNPVSAIIMFGIVILFFFFYWKATGRFLIFDMFADATKNVKWN